jgi:hypothetical protein
VQKLADRKWQENRLPGQAVDALRRRGAGCHAARPGRSERVAGVAGAERWDARLAVVGPGGRTGDEPGSVVLLAKRAATTTRCEAGPPGETGSAPGWRCRPTRWQERLLQLGWRPVLDGTGSRMLAVNAPA